MTARVLALLGLRSQRRLGTLGLLACLVFGMATAILAQGWRVAIACGLALLLSLVFFPVALSVLASRRYWLFITFLILPAVLLLGPGTWAVGPITLSAQGLETGVRMALRATALIVAVTGFAASVSVSDLASLVEGAGLRGLGFALGVAVNMLPTIQEMTTNAYQALRLRGGFRRRRWQAIRLLLVTVVVNSLRHADDIVGAAEARAFSTVRAQPQRIPWRAEDVAVAVVLLFTAVVVAWA